MGTVLVIWLISGCTGDKCENCNHPSELRAPVGVAVSWPEGEATFFSLESNDVVATEVLEGWSLAADFSPMGDFAAFANNRTDQVTIYALPELEVVNIFPLPGNPMEVLYNRTGTHVYVLTSNAIFHRFSVEGGQVETATVGPSPTRFSIQPLSENEAWIACEESQEIIVVSLISMAAIDTIDFSNTPTSVCHSPDGSEVFVALSNGGGVHVFNAASRDYIETLPAGAGPIELDVSANGDYLVASDSTEGTVTLWNLETHEDWSIEVGGSAGRVRFGKDSHDFCVFSGEENHVFRVAVLDTGITIVNTILVPETVREIALWEN